jgi:hypothetical protein
MSFLYWLYVLAHLRLAYWRGQRPIGAAEYVKAMEDANEK